MIGSLPVEGQSIILRTEVFAGSVSMTVRLLMSDLLTGSEGFGTKRTIALKTPPCPLRGLGRNSVTTLFADLEISGDAVKKSSKLLIVLKN